MPQEACERCVVELVIFDNNNAYAFRFINCIFFIPLIYNEWIDIFTCFSSKSFSSCIERQKMSSLTYLDGLGVDSSNIILFVSLSHCMCPIGENHLWIFKIAFHVIPWKGSRECLENFGIPKWIPNNNITTSWASVNYNKTYDGFKSEFIINLWWSELFAQIKDTFSTSRCNGITTMHCCTWNHYSNDINLHWLLYLIIMYDARNLFW